jgi:hypothetical protein
MKKIEQAAKEFSEKAVPQFETPESIILTKAYRIGFTAGVEFAQQWHDVNEELPEIGYIVLLKSKTNGISTGYFSNGKFEIDFNEMVNKDITHWREIEKQ